MEFDDTREKLETFINYYYLNVNSFEEDIYSEIQPINVSVLVFKNFVLTVSRKKNFFFFFFFFFFFLEIIIFIVYIYIY